MNSVIEPVINQMKYFTKDDSNGRSWNPQYTILHLYTHLLVNDTSFRNTITNLVLVNQRIDLIINKILVKHDKPEKKKIIHRE